MKFTFLILMEMNPIDSGPKIGPSQSLHSTHIYANGQC